MKPPANPQRSTGIQPVPGRLTGISFAGGQVVSRSLIVASALFVLAFLSGCAVGPNYHPPKTDVPAQWASELAAGETNASAADPAWWKTFHDPELDSLMTRAVQSNLNLRAAEAHIREARAMRTLVAAGLWPTGDAMAQFERQRVSANGFPPIPPGIPLEGNLYQAGFDTAWEIDVFGGTRRAVEAADASLGGAVAQQRATLVSLLGEVSRDYTEARGAQRRLAIAHDSIKAEQEQVRLTQDRYHAGLTGDLDVQQASALLATTEAQVPTLETQFRQSAFALGVLLGQAPGTVLDELTNATPIPATPPAVPAGLPSDLLRRRPDIQQTERQLAAATAQIGVATADLYPKFSLTGDIGLQSLSASDWFTEGSRFWQVGPTVQWRIFDAGRIRANIRVQNARQEQALAGYEATVLNAMQEVESALTAYGKEQQRRQSLTAAANASQQALSLSQQLYQNGLTDFLPVLDAQRSLYSSQDALAQSDRDLALDLVALYKALGGGWESLPSEARK